MTSPLERVHGGRVERDVPGDQPVLKPAVLEGAGDGLEGGLPPQMTVFAGEFSQAISTRATPSLPGRRGRRAP